MSGQTRHQSQHEGWLECVRPKDRPEVMEGWYRAIEKRQYFEFSFRILHAGGKIRHVRSRGTQIAQAEHPCIGYIIWIEDASEHHLVAGERCEHTEILERSLNGIYIFDADTLRYEFVNEDARRNLGYDMCDLRKMTPVEIQPLFDQTQFELAIKPLRTGEITGVEALIRWQHPTLGPASPSEFIPIANETDLMFDLDAWVIGEACRQFTEWQREFTFEASP